MEYWAVLVVSLFTIEIVSSAGYNFPPLPPRSWNPAQPVSLARFGRSPSGKKSQSQVTNGPDGVTENVQIGGAGGPQIQGGNYVGKGGSINMGNWGQSLQSQTTKGPNGVTRNLQIGGGGPQIQGGLSVDKKGSFSMGDLGWNYQRQSARAGPNTKVQMTQEVAPKVPTFQYQTVKGKPGQVGLTRIGSGSLAEVQYQGVNKDKNGNSQNVQVGNGIQVQGIGGIPDTNGIISEATLTSDEKKAQKEKEKSEKAARKEIVAKENEAQKERERLETRKEKERERQYWTAQRSNSNVNMFTGADGVGYQTSVTSGSEGTVQSTQIGSGPQIQGGNYVKGNGKIAMGSWGQLGDLNRGPTINPSNPKPPNSWTNLQAQYFKSNGDFNMAKMGPNNMQNNGRPGRTPVQKSFSTGDFDGKTSKPGITKTYLVQPNGGYANLPGMGLVRVGNGIKVR